MIRHLCLPLLALLLVTTSGSTRAQQPPAGPPDAGQAAPADAPPAESDAVADTPAATPDGAPAADRDADTAPAGKAAQNRGGGRKKPGTAGHRTAGASGLDVPVSRGASAYADLLKKAMVLEVQVQDFERSTDLGREDPDKLEGYRKARRLRIEKDKDFASLSKQLSMSAMAAPQATDATKVSREGRAVLSALDRSYEGSRDTKELEQYMDANRSFLKTADWSARDRAVQMRDAVVQREIGYTTLMKQAVQLVQGTAPDGTVEQMRKTLDEVAPESAGPQDDLASLVVKDPALRDDVFKELTSLLTAPAEAPPAPRDVDDLTPEINSLQVALVQKANLESVVAEHAHVLEQLGAVDAGIESKPSPDLVQQKSELLARRYELEDQWYKTPPDQETFQKLVNDQNELSRRLMDDLGPEGVLYGPRLADVESAASRPAQDPLAQWRLLEQQRDLLTALDAARPAVDPLAGLTPPPPAPKPVAPPVQGQFKAAPKAVPKPMPKHKPHPHPKAEKPFVNPNAKIGQQHGHPHGGHGHGNGMGLGF